MRNDSVRAVLVFAALIAAPALATASSSEGRPFPMVAVAAGEGEVILHPALHELDEIRSLSRVVFKEVPVPGGGAVTLELKRVILSEATTRVFVDGQPVDFRMPASFWSGRISGQEDSYAFLALSQYGCRGWFGTAGNVNHLIARPNVQGDWNFSDSRLVTSERLDRDGFKPEFNCNLLDTPGSSGLIEVDPSAPMSALTGPIPNFDAPIAFETDYEFYQDTFGGNMPAAQTYAFSLIASISDRYREQVGVIFSLPYVGFHSVNNDGWTSTDCFGRLEQFRSAWANGGAPVHAELYHLISGVPVSGCGGVAYLPGLCDQQYGFGMSAHINGNVTFPPVQGPLTWDFMVVAHELGHNFGSMHTHDYSPPIDRCASGDCTVTPNGTIMSYCHTCPGGMSNITLYFHSRVATVIRNFVVASSCIDPFRGVLTDDIGFALAGSNGTPALDVLYHQGAPDTMEIDIQNAPVNQSGMLVIGVSAAMTPIFGGTLVPSLDVLIPITANASGVVNFSFPVNLSVPNGVPFWTQAWIQDPAGANPYAATNAIEGELITP